MDIEELRWQRELQCFAYINRCQWWYDSLTREQLEELKKWYQEWLDVTKTFKIPQKPNWLN